MLVRNPYDGSVVGEVPTCDARGVRAAIARAHEALPDVLPQHERAAILERAAGLVIASRDQLAELICAEAGKPITAAQVEVDRAADTLRFCAIEARTLAGEVVPMEGSASGAGKLGFTLRRPIGVVAAITPFNFPLNLSCHKVGPAIAAGCPVVHKPASATPLIATELHRILLEAGLPKQQYQLVVGSGTEIGGVLTSDDRIALITFTGSSDVGWSIRHSVTRARVSLELGNVTPLLAFDDTDINELADIVARGGFAYAGQSCISVQRVLIQQSMYEAAVEAIGEQVSSLACGDPRDPDVVVGPLIDEAGREKVLAMIRSTIDAGARLITGGGHSGNVVQPCVLADVDPSADIARRELFGPAVALMPFEGEEHAIELANGTPYGLQAGLLCRNMQLALRVASRLEFGGVIVNELPSFRADQMPYGGMKESGNTREGPRYAVNEMSDSTLVVLQR